MDFFQQPAFAHQRPVGAAALRFFQPQAAGGIGLRIKVEQQNPFAQPPRRMPATLTAVVVFPTPPFWLATAMTLVGTVQV